MNYSIDLSVIEWLKSSVSTTITGPILRVKDVLPDVFATYTALLPAVGIIENFPFNKINLNDPSIAQLNINAAIWGHYGTHNVHRTPNYTPTRFSNLAAQFDLPYDLSMVRQIEWEKRGFATQTERTASGLSTLLKSLALDNQLLLYIEDYWRWEAIQLLPSAAEVVYHVTVEEFITFLKDAFFDATLYLFPQDRSWCLVNVEDGFCPIIGTSMEVGTVIAAQSITETIQLTSESEL